MKTTWRGIRVLVLFCLGQRACAMTYTVMDANMGWKMATKACSADSGKLHLAGPSARSQINAIAKSHFNWIDLHYVSGQWLRSDGTLPATNHWLPGYPDLRFGSCAGYQLSTGLWWTDDCSRYLGIICEHADDTSTTPPPSTTSPASSPSTTSVPVNCPDGWNSAAGGCYKLVADGEKSQSSAQRHCDNFRKGKANLVSIHSDSQLAAVKKLVAAAKTAAWTGLLFRSIQNDLVWTDKSDTKYIEYIDLPARPPSDKCATLAANGWQWHACNSVQDYLCFISTGSISMS